MSEQQWKLVPVEPTPQMQEDGCQGYLDADGKIGIMHMSSMGHAYRAMLAAAPQPPALGGEPEVIAEVINKYGDPEAFAQRDILHRADIDKLKIGTELVDRAHVARLQAEVERLRSNAARYEWIRSRGAPWRDLEQTLFERVNDECNPPYMALKFGAELDAAIDAALAEGAKS